MIRKDGGGEQQLAHNETFLSNDQMRCGNGKCSAEKRSLHRSAPYRMGSASSHILMYLETQSTKSYSLIIVKGDNDDTDTDKKQTKKKTKPFGPIRRSRTPQRK